MEHRFDEYLNVPVDVSRPDPPRAGLRAHPGAASRRRRARVTLAVALAGLTLGGVGALVLVTPEDTSSRVEPRSRAATTSEGQAPRRVPAIPAGPSCVVSARTSPQSPTNIGLAVGDCAAGLQEIRVQPVAPLGPFIAVTDLVTEQGTVMTCQLVAGGARCGPVPADGLRAVFVGTADMGAGTRGPDAKLRATFVRRDGSSSETVVPLP